MADSVINSEWPACMTLQVPPTSQSAQEEGMRGKWMRVTGVLKQIWTQGCHRCAVVSKVIEVISGAEQPRVH